jgi:GrpB-like predicted nucleotidyltransferase (UPF0157 family)
MINIVEYDPAWPERFEAEAASLREVLGDRALRIEHVGSTAVPGLAAKPVIDIQISVASLERLGAYSELLTRLGYCHVPVGTFDLVYPFFQKPAAWPSTHHVHLCLLNGEQERRHLAFRDYLRGNPMTAAEYVELKRSLAAAHDGETQESRERYSNSKSEFVEAVLAKALSQGYPRANPSDRP